MFTVDQIKAVHSKVKSGADMEACLQLKNPLYLTCLASSSVVSSVGGLRYNFKKS